MAPASDEQKPASAPGAIRLKLVMPQSQPGLPHTQSPASQERSSSNRASSSGSPERPSYSPVTPTLSEAVLPVQSVTTNGPPPAPKFIDTPESQTVNLEENADAIALRAALSILQVQRQQSLKDIRDLDRMKAAAIEDPAGFVEHLKASDTTTGIRQGVDFDVEDDLSEEDVKMDDEKPSKLPKFPTAQNIVRMPPIEWAKYGIVGEPLDKMHDQQRRQPGTQPNMSHKQNTREGHRIAKPYDPFTDRIEAKK